MSYRQWEKVPSATGSEERVSRDSPRRPSGSWTAGATPGSTSTAVRGFSPGRRDPWRDRPPAWSAPGFPRGAWSTSRIRPASSTRSFITDPQVVRKVLEHLGLWLANARPVSRAQSPPPASQGRPDPSFCQLPRPARMISASSRLRRGISEAAGNVVPGESARIAPSGLGRFSLHTAGIPPRAARRVLLAGIQMARARCGPKPDPVCCVFFALTHNNAQCYPLPS